MGEPARILAVFVPGRPAPQGSIRAIVHKHTGRAVAIKDNNKTQKTWREDVRQACLDGAGQPLTRVEGAVSVRLHFVMPRPKSTPKKITPAATKKPDVDKLERAVLDALCSAGVFHDDAQVVELLGTKRIAEPNESSGCLIHVQPTFGPRSGADGIDWRSIAVRLAERGDWGGLSTRETDVLQDELLDHIEANREVRDERTADAATLWEDR